MPLRSNFHAFLHRICEGTEQIREIINISAGEKILWQKCNETIYNAEKDGERMKTILVVDDDEMNLKVARFMLEQNGYFVITALSGIECLGILKNQSVDLILLDVEMPIMNGIKTLEHIREQKEFAHLPVMFLTADGNEDTVIAAGKLDAAGYLKKPYMPQDFLERVEKIIHANDIK